MHLNRVIKAYDLDMFYIAGPGHGGPALVANTYLEGSYTEVYPNFGQDEAGLTGPCVVSDPLAGDAIRLILTH